MLSIERPWIRIPLALLALGLGACAYVWKEAPSRANRHVVSAFTGPATNEEPFVWEGFACAERPGLICHASSTVALPGGRMAATWYSGSAERAPDVAIRWAVFSRGKGHDGPHWSEARTLVDRATCAQELGQLVRCVGNPVLVGDNQGHLWLFYCSIASGGWSMATLNYKLSRDDGQTWSPSRKLVLSPFFNLTHNVKNRALLLDDGSFLLPLYSELATKNSSLLWFRPEVPPVWTGFDDVAAYEAVRITEETKAIQPALVGEDNGHVLALFRNTDRGRALAARSTDLGVQWSPVEAVATLPNPNSGFDAIRLDNGHYLAALNDSTTDRSNLTLMVSADKGVSWKPLKVLEQKPLVDFAYPSLNRGTDGLYHLTYSYESHRIKHLAFNEAWVRSLQP